jgi:hypothetical protein
MRLARAVVALSIGAFAAPCAAQGVDFGAKIGLNASTVSGFKGPLGGLDAGYRRDLMGGPFVAIPITEALAIQPELLFTRKRASLTGSAADVSASITVLFECLEVPILARLMIPGSRRVYGLAGPVLGRLLSTTERIEALSLTTERDISLARRFELSIVAGAALRLGGFLLEGRYSQGLTNLAEEAGSVKSRLVAVLAGMQF